MRVTPAPHFRAPSVNMTIINPQPIADSFKRLVSSLQLTKRPDSAGGRMLQILPAVVAAVVIVTVTMPRGPPLVAAQRHCWGDWLKSWCGRLLYALTAINPCFSVLANDYTFLRDAARSFVGRRRQHEAFSEQEETLRRVVTGIGAIKPRRLFVLGAALRGAQLHSPLKRVFDPPAHFGVGVNMLALFDGVASPASFTLGWAVSAPWWNFGCSDVSSLVGDNETPLTGECAGSSRRQRMSHATEATASREASRGASMGNALAATSSESTHRTQKRREGLRIALWIPSAHVSLVMVALLVANNKLVALRYMSLVMACAGHWSVGDAAVRPGA